MHQFDAGHDRARRSKRFETGHGPRDAFDRAVILLDNVVEVFDPPNRDRYVAFLVQLLQSCLVGVTLSGTVLCRMAFSKKRLAAAASRFAVNRKSTV